ncbi:CC_3452 family protein [Novosphingobium lentum]|uniref:CC_3452 family protein n=1 Tax=Novosphingobium lentum TaxID=145287 RepID=UPI00082AA6F2|nr:hypothetical protein [Novosphingobium lentum]
MTRFQQSAPARQLMFAALALIGTVGSFGAITGTAHAATPTFYTAALVKPVSAPQHVIVDGVMWNCSGTECIAPRDGSRTANVCARLVRKLGPVSRFATPQGDLAAADLTQCNGAS